MAEKPHQGRIKAWSKSPCHDGEPSRLKGWPNKGDQMVYLGKNGYEHEREEADKIFALDRQYEVLDIDIGDWSHTIAFVGVPGRWNGVMFDHACKTS